MIGAISGANTYIYSPRNTQQSANIWPVRSSGGATAVEPVVPVRPTDTVGPKQEKIFNQQLPTIREGADPVEMAVRMRIQYPDSQGEAASGVKLPVGAEKSESLEFPALEGDAALGASDIQKAAEEGRCETCEKRKYQDGSNDPGVSFKTPTNIRPEQAASAVRGHEQEHVVREQARAQREDRRVVSQSVTYHTDICPECGKVYVSGGTTRTVTAANNQSAPQQDASEQDRARTPFSAVA